MSISYERTGRTQQKARTRDALIATTRRLLAQGTTPTVEQAAAAAQISRATAYRYFPNQRTLLAATYPHLDRRSLLPTPAPPDPAARLAAVVDAQTQLVLELEPEVRTQLRLPADGRHDQQHAHRGLPSHRAAQRTAHAQPASSHRSARCARLHPARLPAHDAGAGAEGRCAPMILTPPRLDPGIPRLAKRVRP